jgi:thiol-disulfide isomerase/thioredoxin
VSDAPAPEPKQKVDKITLFFIGALLLGAVLMGWQEVLELDVLPRGSRAPPFEVKRLDGSTLSLESLQGRVVVVNFWATWCPPCREELPYLVSTIREYEARGVTLVAVNTDDLGGQRDALQRFLARMPDLAPYAVLGRPDVGAAYEVRAVPSNYVIDRAGRVSASFRGQATEAQLRRWLDEALSP